MLDYLLDIVFVAVVIASTIFVGRRMMFEAALIFLALIFSSLVTIMLFEPFAEWCSRNLFQLSDIHISKYSWICSVGLIFGVLFSVLMNMFSAVCVDIPHFGRRVESVGSWIFGALTGYFLAAFLLTLLHTVPGPRDFWHSFNPDAKQRPGPIMAMAPDYQFLAFVQLVCSGELPTSTNPWKDDFPLISPQIKRGRWASYPIRYALWREDLARLAADEEESDLPAEEEAQSSEDEAVQAEEHNSLDSDGESSPPEPPTDEQE